MTVLDNNRITDWPVSERPREKLMKQGVQVLSDAELLAIFLRTGLKGKTAVDLSRDLIRQFGGLRQVLQLDRHRFFEQKGLGPAKYCQLQSVLEMAKRHLKQKIADYDVLRSPKLARYYIKMQLREEQREVFSCLFLNAQYRIMGFEKLFYGTLDRAAVYPREIVKMALHYNAAALIFAHNHPSGIATPSEEDLLITARLKHLFAEIGVAVVDHIIVGDQRIFSFSERGLI